MLDRILMAGVVVSFFVILLSPIPFYGSSAEWEQTMVSDYYTHAGLLGGATQKNIEDVRHAYGEEVAVFAEASRIGVQEISVLLFLVNVILLLQAGIPKLQKDALGEMLRIALFAMVCFQFLLVWLLFWPDIHELDAGKFSFRMDQSGMFAYSFMFALWSLGSSSVFVMIARILQQLTALR